MTSLRCVLPALLLAASVPAAAYDAARCAETRAYIARLQDNLSHNPTASDRTAFQQALSVYRRVEPEFCNRSGGAAGGGGAGSSPELSNLVEALQGLNAILSRDASAWRPAPTGPALPAPPQSTGSVTGPMAMQRLGGTKPGNASGASGAMPAGMAMRGPYPTDEEIGVHCATAVNPSMCELGLQAQRDQDPGYRRWREAESVRMEGSIDAAIAGVDAAIAAAHSGQPPRVVIPVAPSPQPYDNSDPDLAKCREGEKAPWTIAGCYDLGRPPPAPPKLAKKARKARPAPSDDEQVATPSTRADEERYRQHWIQTAQANLLAAIQKGQKPVPEDLDSRATCKGAWFYDGFSKGVCGDWDHPVLYEVEVPQAPPPARADDASQ